MGFNDIQDDMNPYKDEILYPTAIIHEHKSLQSLDMPCFNSE